MAIIDKLFEVAKEYYTLDSALLQIYQNFIDDAENDEVIKTTDNRYTRAVALRTAAMLKDAGYGRSGVALSPGGYGIRVEETSHSRIEYQYSAQVGNTNMPTSNIYWDQYWRLVGIAGLSTPMASNQ